MDTGQDSGYADLQRAAISNHDMAAIVRRYIVTANSNDAAQSDDLAIVEAGLLASTLARQRPLNARYTVYGFKFTSPSGYLIFQALPQNLYRKTLIVVSIDGSGGSGSYNYQFAQSPTSGLKLDTVTVLSYLSSSVIFTKQKIYNPPPTNAVSIIDNSGVVGGFINAVVIESY